MAKVSSAAGVRGTLCLSFEGRYFFRVYGSDGAFIDYDLRHDELEATIAEEALASFYDLGEAHVLDHSPAVLRLKRA